MNLLALDTSSVACSVALSSNTEVYVQHSELDRTHAATVLEKIDVVLKQAGLGLSDLTAIAYGAGPGSFTGVRIGISVAQGLGLANSVPLISISSLQVVAQGALRKTDAASVCVAQDARMNEIYTARFERHGKIARLMGSEALLSPEAVMADATDGLAGDAWERVQILQDLAAERQALNKWPNAKDMLPLAAKALAEGRVLPADKAGLDYLRNSVTQPPVTKV